MTAEASTLGRIARLDRERDRRREIRDSLLAALASAGRALTPSDLARRTGLGACTVSLSAARSPAYFAVQYDSERKRILSVDRHPHLKLWN